MRKLFFMLCVGEDGVGGWRKINKKKFQERRLIIIGEESRSSPPTKAREKDEKRWKLC